MAEGAAGNRMNAKLQLQAELEQLLSEPVESARHRAQSFFDEQAGSLADSLVLFGAGNIGRKMVKGLRSAGIEPHAFADNNAALWGSAIDGLQVLSPKDAAEQYGQNAAFLITIWRGEGSDTMEERCRPLRDLGCRTVLSFGAVFWKYPDIFLPHYSLDLPHRVLEQADEIRTAFELWQDDDSRHEFVAQIRWRLHLDFDGLPRPVTHEIYMPDDLVTVSAEERFVDCGAFDGDTLRSFVNKRNEAFGRYFAFEADPTNYANLCKTVSALSAPQRAKIATYALAVGARRKKVYFNAMGTESSAMGFEGIEIDCAPLDELLRGESPTWIKMDIEGAELEALSGARTLISEDAPVLAICVYHLQNHVWKIPLLVGQLSTEYRFFLRPHLLESWDLVCYAIPAKRLHSGSAPSL